MTTATRAPHLNSSTCTNCWWRPAEDGWPTCKPCFFRPDVWRVPCTCSTCPHGKTGHCEDCRNTTDNDRNGERS